MGRYSDKLMSTSVVSPNNKIVNFGDEYISKEPTTFTFHVMDSFYKYEILDSNGNECFKAKHSRMTNYITLYDLNKKPLATIKNGFNCQKIFSDTEYDKEMACFKFRNTSTQLHKFNVEYFNKATKRSEILKINCSRSYRTIGVFDGKESEGAPMICRMDTKSLEYFSPYKNFRYNIEIAPNVDVLYMISLFIFILRLNIRRRHHAGIPLIAALGVN